MESPYNGRYARMPRPLTTQPPGARPPGARPPEPPLAMPRRRRKAHRRRIDALRLLCFVSLVAVVVALPIYAMRTAQGGVTQEGMGPQAQEPSQRQPASAAPTQEPSTGAAGSKTPTPGAGSPYAIYDPMATPREAPTPKPSPTTEPIDETVAGTAAETTTETTTETATETSAAPVPVAITISAIGDCTLGYDDSQGAEGRFDRVYKAAGDSAYFFSNVIGVLGADDLTIANLEGVFTESTKKEDKAYRFHGDPAYAQILKAGSVEAVNLANNHTLDYFQRGYDDTTAALDAASVIHFGGGSVRIVDVKGVRVGLAGFHIGGGGWSHRQKQIDAAFKAFDGTTDLRIFSFHWGIEGRYEPTADQISLARHCVDKGADLVLGHHPHNLQGIETYKGRTIAYSLGNFCFGGNRNPNDKDTMILQQAFGFDLSAPGAATLVSIGDAAAIPASVSSSAGRNDYKPRTLEGEEAERVSKKIDELSAKIKP